MSNRKRGEAHAERVEMLAGMPDAFTVWEFADRYGLDYDQARSVMRYMCGSGLLIKEGTYHQRIYRKVKDASVYPVTVSHHNPTTSAPTGLAGLFFRYG